MKKKIILALLSPQKDAVSETFIRAHKQLPFTIKHYYGGYFPTKLESVITIYRFTIFEKLLFKLSNKKDYHRKAIIKSFKKEKISCILAEYGPVGAEITSIARSLNIPMITHFHGFDATNPQTVDSYKTAYKEMFNYASGIIVVSQKMKQDILKLGCPEQKISINPCGPNPCFLTNKPAFSQNLFIAVARFVEVKGYLFTLTAFHRVVQECPSARLVCIGDGPQIESCKQFVKIMCLEDSVRFMGERTPDEIQALFHESLAFLQHSVALSNGLNEGAPVSVMEAMAAGLPVVCSNSGGIKDLVVHKETGYLVEEFDTNNMSQYMITLINDKSSAKKMGEAARLRIQNQLSLSTHLHKIQTLIEKAVD